MVQFYIFDAGLMVARFLIYLLHATGWINLTKTIQIPIYLGAYALLPLLAVLAAAVLARRGPASLDFARLSGALCLGLALLPAEKPWLLGVVAGLDLLLLFWAWRRPLRLPDYARHLALGLAVLALIVVIRNLEVINSLIEIFYWPFFDKIFGPLYAPDNIKVLGPRWTWFCAGAILAAALFIHSRRSIMIGAHRGWAVLSLAIWSLLLTDSSLSLNLNHYEAYIGPLQKTLQGGWPLLDVFPQYGLSYFIFFPAALLAPGSFDAAGLTVMLIDGAMLFVTGLFLLMRSDADRRGLPLILLFLLGLKVCQPYILTITPSVYGVRFMPVWGLALWLASRPSRQTLGWVGGSLVVLCSMWAIEVWMMGVPLAALQLAAAARLAGHSWGVAMLRGARAILLALAGPIAFALLTRFLIGQWPRPDLYLDILQAYIDRPNYWFKVLPSTGHWATFALAAIGATGLMLMWRRLLAGHQPEDKSVNNDRAVTYGLLAAAGALMSLYHAGRSLPTLLAIVALPGLTMIGLAILNRPTQRPLLAGSAALLAAMLFGGFAIDKFVKPPTAKQIGTANHVWLRTCLSECAPWALLDRLNVAAELIRYYPDLRYPVADIAALLPPGEKTVRVLALRKTSLLYWTGWHDAFAVTNGDNDRLSRNLVARARARLDALPDGTEIVISGTPHRFVFDYELLEYLQTKRTLCETARLPSGVYRVRLAPLGSAC